MFDPNDPRNQRRMFVSAADMEEVRAAHDAAMRPQTVSGGASPAVIGKQTAMNTQPAGGGNVTLVDTQLISMRVNEPKQWLVTLRQPTVPNGVQPWANDFDGGAFGAGSLFGAPGIPSAAGGAKNSALQCTLRWGAGGVSFQSRFDSPVAGGTFGVTADTFDLNVALNVQAGQDGIPAAMVPVIGAFMVPGQATDNTPLRWLEQKTAAPAGQSVFFGLKPYAKKLHLVMPLCTKATVQWLSRNGAGNATIGLTSTALVEDPAGRGIDTVLDVPAQAELVIVTNTGAVGSNVYAEWWIGLVA